MPKLLETLNIRGLLFNVEFIDNEEKVVTLIRHNSHLGGFGLDQLCISFKDFESIKTHNKKLLKIVRRAAA